MGEAFPKDNAMGAGDQPEASGKWMRTDEAVAWIAFRRSLPLDRWEELTDGLLKRSLREWELSCAFKFPDQPTILLRAIEARTAGHVWRGFPPYPAGPRRKSPTDVGRLWPSLPTFAPAWSYRAHVRRLMRRIGPPVQGLAAELRHDVELLTEFDHKIEAAHSVLIEAVREGRMTAWGRRAYGWGEPNVSAEHEAISATLFLGPRTIEFTDWLVYDKTRPPKEWAGYQGPYFDLIRFRAAEAMRLWPSPEDTAAMSGQGQSDGLAAARAWMDKHTANLKVLPKREVMLADCRKATGCNYRQALAAWGALPPERKRKPRQTDRKLSKAAAR